MTNYPLEESLRARKTPIFGVKEKEIQNNLKV
jgi:hypothetical protein